MSSCISSFWAWLRRGQWVALSCRWKASGSTYRWATHSRLEPVIKTAKNIQQKLHNVLTYFTHRITTAAGYDSIR